MRIIRKFVPLLLAAAVLLPAADALAMLLGRVRGAALIGRPVNVTVPVTLEANEQETCVQADVYQGDSRMGGITARLETGGNPQIRVTSSGALEEPTVIIYLRVGCAQQVTRRYVLLSEYPDEAVSAPVTQVLPRPAGQGPVPVPGAAGAQGPGGAAAAGSRAAGGAMPANRSTPGRSRTEPRLQARAESRLQGRTAAAPAAGAAPAVTGVPAAAAGIASAEPSTRKSARAQAREAREAATARPRLKLEPLDLSIDYSPSLRASRQMLTQEAGGMKRAEAAALWTALNTPTEEMIRQSQRIESMEREVKALRDSVRQNNAALGAVGSQLQKARSERNWVSTVSAGLALLLAVGVGFLLWRRRGGVRDGVRGGGHWWQRESAAGLDSGFMEANEPPAAPSRAPVRPREPEAAAPEVRESFRAPERSPSARARAPEPGTDSQPSQAMNLDFLPSQTGSMRTVKAEELIDIQQQAEFFLSIGHADQALSVLEAHVHDHVETSPVVWLDLLEMYHTMQRPEEYERIRSEFRTAFNAEVPAFDDYRAASNGLEDYRRALSRIVALWPSARVLEVIEESIFRKPGAPGSESFDVEAYRDLLMLYNIARILNDESASSSDQDEDSGWHQDARQTGFASTDIQPLSALVSDASRFAPMGVEPSTHVEPMLELDAPPDAGLDIDLEAMAPPEADKLDLPGLEFDFDSLPPKRR